jgi:uncharacterized membrane protein
VKNFIQQIDQPAFLENFARDPIANSIAVVVLIFMIVSVIAVLISFLKDSSQNKRMWPKWSVPILAALGIGVAGYLMYVEWTGTNAVCGPTGDCNAVQDSPYAKLFGILPVGLLGVAGYAAILASWFLAEFGPSGLKKIFNLLIWGMAWFGVAFSIYLTFLEPFVIGATCMWCITSAILITLILIESTAPANEFLKVEEDEFDYQEVAEA